MFTVGRKFLNWLRATGRYLGGDKVIIPPDRYFGSCLFEYTENIRIIPKKIDLPL